jgi:hypothetical protein
MLSAWRPATFENLQLNSGAFLFGFDHSGFSDAGALEDAILAILEEEGEELMGATVGDGSFVAEPEIRNIEGNGKRYDTVGATVNDSWKCRLTGTMKEVNPQNFKRAALSCDMVKTGNVTKLTIRTQIKREDYIPKLCWVGDTSNGFVLIELDNVLNISGVTFTFTDKGEGTLPFEFLAHVDDVKKQDEAPARILFFDKAA